MYGFGDLADAMANPQHPQHAELHEWYEGQKPGPLSQEDFNDWVNAVAALQPTPRAPRMR